MLLLLAVASFTLLSSAHASASKVAGAWYAGWHATNGYPLSEVSWDKYNTMYYSFASTTSDVNSLSLQDSDGSVLPQFVSEAHAHGVKAHIAIGGWGGSVYFSSDVATAKNRTAFVNTVIDFVEEYDLDGVNFDWEYPNKQGIGCNIVNSDDTANFLSFLQELREDCSNITISAAVSVTPFRDSNGNPSTDVSAFAKVLDYIAIMDYDIWGSWSTAVGPNAPLNDTCAKSSEQQGSAVSAVKAWSNAGMPVDQIVLGVPSYGHSFSVKPSDAFVSGTTTLAAYPAFDASNQPAGDAWDATGSVDACGNYEGSGGTFNLWGLVDGGFLNSEGTTADGIYYRFDSCSQTPYVYNETSEVMISYDNAESFTAKGTFIKNTGLLGYAMWQAGGDYNNILIDAINSAV
ncbi:glycoside hydrolase family 18 protein [Suillus clintonianus]|uniref:glycoside hydrolase family 18 protein n=1 Tax=Suillus clintonianus TaxID=1904413 RepID=UPI001B865D4A|nr:glycoside hydrolase family 18 protein [Suillus clintonianus]KAG2127519.1 glycoside hydrolase family 18 protein [Suillus clintonianus]